MSIFFQWSRWAEVNGSGAWGSLKGKFGLVPQDSSDDSLSPQVLRLRL
jgi:hypothetical protein